MVARFVWNESGSATRTIRGLAVVFWSFGGIVLPIGILAIWAAVVVGGMACGNVAAFERQDITPQRTDVRNFQPAGFHG